MQRHRTGRPFADSFTNFCSCTSSLTSAKPTPPVQRQMRGGKTLVLLRLTPAEQTRLLPLLQSSSLGNGGVCRWGSLGITRLSSSSCYTTKGSLGRRVAFLLETSLPACVDVTIQPDGCQLPQGPCAGAGMRQRREMFRMQAAEEPRQVPFPSWGLPGG